MSERVFNLIVLILGIIILVAGFIIQSDFSLLLVMIGGFMVGSSLLE